MSTKVTTRTIGVELAHATAGVLDFLGKVLEAPQKVVVARAIDALKAQVLADPDYKDQVAAIHTEMQRDLELQRSALLSLIDATPEPAPEVKPKRGLRSAPAGDDAA